MSEKKKILLQAADVTSGKTRVSVMEFGAVHKGRPLGEGVGQM